MHCAPSVLECTGKLPFPILMMQRVSVIISHIYWLMMIIKLKTKVQKTRENNTCGEGISTKKIKDIKVRWKFEAKLRSRYRITRQTGDKTVEAAWEESESCGQLRKCVEC